MFDFNPSYLNKPQQAHICNFAGPEVCKQLERDINKPFYFVALIIINNGKFSCDLVIPAPQEVRYLDEKTLTGQAIPKNHPGTAVLKIDGKIVRQEIKAEHSMVGVHTRFSNQTLGTIWNNNPSGEFTLPLKNSILNSAQLEGITANSSLFTAVNTEKGLVDCRVEEGKVGQEIDEKAKGQDSPDTKVEKFRAADLPKVSTQLASLVASVVQNFEKEQ